MTSDKDLAVEILDYTKTSSMLKDVSPTFNNPIQKDIDQYAADNNIVDVTLGNNQLVWGLRVKSPLKTVSKRQMEELMQAVQVQNKKLKQM